MGLAIGWLNIDAHDVQRLTSFWEQALPGSTITYATDDGAVLKTDQGWRLLFYKVPDEKVVKNRVHLDLIPDDRDAEVARLEALGATRADIGQNQEDISWIVMADPEGNEFCVLRAGADQGA